MRFLTLNGAITDIPSSNYLLCCYKVPDLCKGLCRAKSKALGHLQADGNKIRIGTCNIDWSRGHREEAISVGTIGLTGFYSGLSLTCFVTLSKLSFDSGTQCLLSAEILYLARILQ